MTLCKSKKKKGQKKKNINEKRIYSTKLFFFSLGVPPNHCQSSHLIFGAAMFAFVCFSPKVFYKVSPNSFL